MSDFLFAKNLTGKMTPDVYEVLIGKSTEIHTGDVLVLSVNGTYTANNIAVARPLLSGDTITTSNGIIGYALFGVETDSSANVISVSSPVTVDSAAQAQYALPSIAHALPTDPDTGYRRIYIAAANENNVMQALTDTNEVADMYLLARAVGITASAASFPSNYTVNTNGAAANACLSVYALDTTHANYNSAGGGGRVLVRCKSTFNQMNTNAFFA